MYSTPNHPFIFIAFLFLLLAPTTTWAFKISPCLRVLTYTPGTLDAGRINFFNACKLAPEQYRLPVHEHLTNFSIDEYKGFGFITNAQAQPHTKTSDEQESSYRHEIDWKVGPTIRFHNTSDIIYGSWWNDDPLMFIWGERYDFINGALNLRSIASSTIKPQYPGGRENCPVPRIENLAWNSHFGELQHLHFMSNVAKGDTINNRLNDTLGKSLEWIEFAYSIATLNTSKDVHLTHTEEARLHLPSIGRNYCLEDTNNTKILTLFSRVGMPYVRREKMVPDVALGSIFHVIQDSFSPAHTCRIEETLNGKEYAVLTDVYNYINQDHDAHSDLDTYPAWLLDYSRTGVHKYENDPIRVGAWLLQAVDAGRPWSDVKEYLLNTIFRKSSSPLPAGGKCLGA